MIPGIDLPGIAPLPEPTAAEGAAARDETRLDGDGDRGVTIAPAHRQQLMGVRVGDIGLLLPSDAAREVVSLPLVSRIPKTPPWLLGLANVRGGLVPVVDTPVALGLPSERRLSAYLLIFGAGDASIGLVIGGLPRLLSADEMSPLPDRGAMPALLETSVKSAYHHVGSTWLELDPDTLFTALARSIAL